MNALLLCLAWWLKISAGTTNNEPRPIRNSTFFSTDFSLCAFTDVRWGMTHFIPAHPDAFLFRWSSQHEAPMCSFLSALPGSIHSGPLSCHTGLFPGQYREPRFQPHVRRLCSRWEHQACHVCLPVCRRRTPLCRRGRGYQLLLRRLDGRYGSASLLATQTIYSDLNMNG